MIETDKAELKELIRQVIREELNNPHNFNIHVHYPQQSWANVPMCTTNTIADFKPLNQAE